MAKSQYYNHLGCDETPSWTNYTSDGASIRARSIALGMCHTVQIFQSCFNAISPFHFLLLDSVHLHVCSGTFALAVIELQSKSLEKSSAMKISVIFITLDTILHPKLYKSYLNLSSLADSLQLYTLKYILEITTERIFEKSNNSELQIVLNLEQKSRTGFVLAASATTSQMLNCQTACATHEAQELKVLELESRILTEAQWATNKSDTSGKIPRPLLVYLTWQYKAGRIYTVSLRKRVQYVLRRLRFYVFGANQIYLQI